MNTLDFDDIDYTNMDDLPLIEHIEWDNNVEREVAKEYFSEKELWKPMWSDSYETDTMDAMH